MNNNDQPINAPNSKDLQPIIELLEKYYDGNILLLSKWLDRAIYMFHYLPCDEEFTAIQRQNTCEALMGIKECLMDAYFRQNELDFDRFV
jgi:hypothetical protein